MLKIASEMNIEFCEDFEKIRGDKVSIALSPEDYRITVEKKLKSVGVLLKRYLISMGFQLGLASTLHSQNTPTWPFLKKYYLATEAEQILESSSKVAKKPDAKSSDTGSADADTCGNLKDNKNWCQFDVQLQGWKFVSLVGVMTRVIVCDLGPFFKYKLFIRF